MSIEALKDALPDYAKDLKLNLSTLAGEETVAAPLRAMLFVASALAVRQADVRDALLAEFGPQLSPEQVGAAKIAVAMMGMNNIYYRFTHLVEAPEYATMPAKLRMTAMARPGIPAAEFEVLSLAVSAINGCGMCMASHEKAVRKHGIEPAVIQAAVRIAAVVHATAVTLDAEAGAGAAPALSQAA
ncbi:MAG: alkyl hydroperoxide reductase [Alphaproteobacteria bacterium]|nr:alkyl hydroperoxide reductase [Alphaproteobacteria bacterium]